MKQSCIQVYTGNGKGKTTAAIGLAIRAAGHGLHVCIIQFMKGKPYGEHAILNTIKQIEVHPVGTEDCIRKEDVTQKHIDAAQAGFNLAKEKMASKKYDVIILDEINVSLWFNLLKLTDVLNLLDAKPAGTELVLTGRYAPEEIIKKADMVTSMEAMKHPYDKGIEVRKGIEY